MGFKELRPRGLPSAKHKISAVFRTGCGAWRVPPRRLFRIGVLPPAALPRPDPSAMNVLSVTLLVSLCLTGIFVAAFLAAHLQQRETGPEHDSLLPLDDTPAPLPTPAAAASHLPDKHVLAPRSTALPAPGPAAAASPILSHESHESEDHH